MAAQRKQRKQQPRPKTARGKEVGPVLRVRRLHRRDLNKVWEFLKRSFRDVNLETVEYQRPRSKKRFFETYEEEGVEQLLFVVEHDIVAYAECTYEIIGSDTWINPRYFEKRDMRPLFVEELAVHPDWHGRGVGTFVMEQLTHLAKVRGLTHLVLEVAENNTHAMVWYRRRGFRKLDASVFMAYSVDVAPELLPPRPLESDRHAVAEEQVVMAVAVDGTASAAARSGANKRKAKGRAGASAGAKPAVSAKPAVAPAKAALKPGIKAAVAGKTAAAVKAALAPGQAALAPGKSAAVATGKLPSASRPGASEPAPAPAPGPADAGSDSKNGQRRAATAPPVAAPSSDLPGRRRT